MAVRTYPRFMVEGPSSEGIVLQPRNVLEDAYLAFVSNTALKNFKLSLVPGSLMLVPYLSVDSSSLGLSLWRYALSMINSQRAALANPETINSLDPGKVGGDSLDDAQAYHNRLKAAFKQIDSPPAKAGIDQGLYNAPVSKVDMEIWDLLRMTGTGGAIHHLNSMDFTTIEWLLILEKQLELQGNGIPEDIAALTSELYVKNLPLAGGFDVMDLGKLSRLALRTFSVYSIPALLVFDFIARYYGGVWVPKYFVEEPGDTSSKSEPPAIDYNASRINWLEWSECDLVNVAALADDLLTAPTSQKVAQLRRALTSKFVAVAAVQPIEGGDATSRVVFPSQYSADKSPYCLSNQIRDRKGSQVNAVLSGFIKPSRYRELIRSGDISPHHFFYSAGMRFEFLKNARTHVSTTLAVDYEALELIRDGARKPFTRTVIEVLAGAMVICGVSLRSVAYQQMLFWRAMNSPFVASMRKYVLVLNGLDEVMKKVGDLTSFNVPKLSQLLLTFLLPFSAPDTKWGKRDVFPADSAMITELTGMTLPKLAEQSDFQTPYGRVPNEQLTNAIAQMFATSNPQWITEICDIHRVIMGVGNKASNLAEALRRTGSAFNVAPWVSSSPYTSASLIPEDGTLPTFSGPLVSPDLGRLSVWDMLRKVALPHHFAAQERGDAIVDFSPNVKAEPVTDASTEEKAAGLGLYHLVVPHCRVSMVYVDREVTPPRLTNFLSAGVQPSGAESYDSAVMKYSTLLGDGARHVDNKLTSWMTLLGVSNSQTMARIIVAELLNRTGEFCHLYKLCSKKTGPDSVSVELDGTEYHIAPRVKRVVVSRVTDSFASLVRLATTRTLPVPWMTLFNVEFGNVIQTRGLFDCDFGINPLDDVSKLSPSMKVVM